MNRKQFEKNIVRTVQAFAPDAKRQDVLDTFYDLPLDITTKSWYTLKKSDCETGMEDVRDQVYTMLREKFGEGKQNLAKVGRYLSLNNFDYKEHAETLKEFFIKIGGELSYDKSHHPVVCYIKL